MPSTKVRKCRNKWDGFIKRCNSLTGSHKCKLDNEDHEGACVCKCGVPQT